MKVVKLFSVVMCIPVNDVTLFSYALRLFFSVRATKRGGGVKALVGGPLKKITFFAASLRFIQ